MAIVQVAATAFLSLALLALPAAAQKKYDPGANDTEIKLGQTMPYSGPLSGFITLAKAEIAYFAMINDQGGVNGRKLNMISLDDGFSPPKTVEQTRRLVEQDQVLAISGSLGTATNAAVQKYLNARKVPQLFLATGASRWADPEHFPYTMTLTPIYQAEARIYATYVLKEIANPAASIGVIMRPAGVEASKGIISAAFVKDPTDPQLKDDPEFQTWVAWMKKYYPAGSLEDPQNVVGYVQAQAMVQVLKQCGDDLTRENVMRQAANLKAFHLAMLLKGINMNTSPTDYEPMEEMALQRFNGERFELFGGLLSARFN